jgi:hypothetical protein
MLGWLGIASSWSGEHKLIFVVLSMLSVDKDKRGLGCICTKGRRRKCMHDGPSINIVTPTVLPVYTVSSWKRKLNAMHKLNTYQRSFASRSISHITPFFRSFFEDVQTEEVFVFFSSFEIGWFRCWLWWYESNAHERAKQTRGKVHATARPHAKRNRVCVCVVDLDRFPVITYASIAIF